MSLQIGYLKLEEIFKESKKNVFDYPLSTTNSIVKSFKWWKKVIFHCSGYCGA
jgi:hypothetical protein